MSIYKNNNNKRVEELFAFSIDMMGPKKGTKLLEKYKNPIEHVTPLDMILIVDKQIQIGIKPEEIKKQVNKIINIFYNTLKEYKWTKPKEGSFLYYLMLENRAFEHRLNKVKKIIKTYKNREESDFNLLQKDLLVHFEEFKKFEPHYLKKENILFPFLEKKWKNHRCLTVMWSFHDDIRKNTEQIIQILKSENARWQELNKKLGAYYFLVFGIIQKEDLIVYPVAAETITNEEWEEMHKQSFEYDFPFIEKPIKSKNFKNVISDIQTDFSKINGDLFLKSETGELNVEQILLLFNNLPLDITFVDENNKVKFFSKPKERFFPRSPAIIGRSVEKCHPPESVDVVEKIIAAFRNNEKENAKFWLKLKNKFILIQYFALRNAKGEYKGVLEVSQDVTEIRSLEGEQRLLDWK